MHPAIDLKFANARTADLHRIWPFDSIEYAPRA
jgi:hypothetical protein